MKAIWQPSPDDRGWPQWDLLRAAGVNRIYFAALRLDYQTGMAFPNTRQISDGYRRGVVSQGFQYGIFRDAHWDHQTDPEAFAEAIHEDIAAATGANKYLACPYMLDMEYPYRDPAWLVALFKAFRRRRPTRLLSWTMEGHQGGWIGSSRPLVDFINRDVNMVVCPQTFLGNMDPAGVEATRQDLVAYGIDPRRVRPCYDAAQPRPAGWDGFLFHAERLGP